MSTKGAEGDGAAPGNYNMNSTHDINSHDIEQSHGAKSITLQFYSDREVNLRFVQENKNINTQLLSAPFLYN